MPSQAAGPDIERRVTAWHEAAHVIAVLLSKHFGVGDPAIDLRPSARGAAFAGAKRLCLSARVTDAEARELVRIAFSGRIGEEWLRRISKDEGRLIQPDPTGASRDFAFADQVIAEHKLETEREDLRRQAEEALADNAFALLTLAQGVWRSPGDILSRAELLAIPEIAEITAKHPKESPLAAVLSSAADPRPDALRRAGPEDDAKLPPVIGTAETTTSEAKNTPSQRPLGFWCRMARALGFR